MSRSLDDLDSRFRPLAEKLIAECAARGCEARVISTLRSLPEQRQAVSDGVSWNLRSKHLPQSPEGKSLAIDLCPEAYLAEKGWNPSGPHWWTIAGVAESLGLRSGMDWFGMGLPPVGEMRRKWDPGHVEFQPGSNK